MTWRQQMILIKVILLDGCIVFLNHRVLIRVAFLEQLMNLFYGIINLCNGSILKIASQFFKSLGRMAGRYIERKRLFSRTLFSFFLFVKLSAKAKAPSYSSKFYEFCALRLPFRHFPLFDIIRCFHAI